jgi:hypothetical protein
MTRVLLTGMSGAGNPFRRGMSTGGGMESFIFIIRHRR